jgi:hypothetical protein
MKSYITPKYHEGNVRKGKVYTRFKELQLCLHTNNMHKINKPKHYEKIVSIAIRLMQLKNVR